MRIIIFVQKRKMSSDEKVLSDLRAQRNVVKNDLDYCTFALRCYDNMRVPLAQHLEQLQHDAASLTEKIRALAPQKKAKGKKEVVEAPKEAAKPTLVHTAPPKRIIIKREPAYRKKEAILRHAANAKVQPKAEERDPDDHFDLNRRTATISNLKKKKTDDYSLDDDDILEVK
jgi:hypothetical protein